MGQEQSGGKVERPKLSVRSGASRKLLEKKATERAAASPEVGDPIEADFPAVEPMDVGAAAEPAAAPVAVGLPVEAAGGLAGVAGIAVPAAAATSATAALEAAGRASLPATARAPAAAQPWSDEDESAFQNLNARRKAAGYQRRGRNVDGQLITAGSIKPNDNTVVAVIVGLVADRGSIVRAELLDIMATTAFPHRAARPDDRGWCLGYVAGAVRDGFLALAEQPAAASLAA